MPSVFDPPQAAWPTSNMSKCVPSSSPSPMLVPAVPSFLTSGVIAQAMVADTKARRAIAQLEWKDTWQYQVPDRPHVPLHLLRNGQECQKRLSLTSVAWRDMLGRVRLYSNTHNPTQWSTAALIRNPEQDAALGTYLSNSTDPESTIFDLGNEVLAMLYQRKTFVHRYDFYGVFKPDMHEVISQVHEGAYDRDAHVLVLLNDWSIGKVEVSTLSSFSSSSLVSKGKRLDTSGSLAPLVSLPQKRTVCFHKCRAHIFRVVSDNWGHSAAVPAPSSVFLPDAWS